MKKDYIVARSIDRNYQNFVLISANSLLDAAKIYTTRYNAVGVTIGIHEEEGTFLLYQQDVKVNKIIKALERELTEIKLI